MNAVVASVLLVACLAGLVTSSSPYGAPRPPCEFAFDCAAVLCQAGIGNAIDGDGCPLRGCPCQGAPNCPALVGCDIECPDASSPLGSLGPIYKTDANGCVQCECDCSNVPIIANDCNLGCSIRPEFCINCPNGNIVNACGGLESCQCDGCPAIELGISCEFGRKPDANGCPTNECNKCSPSACFIFCEFGQVKDANGCDTCTCAPPPSKPGSCPRYGGWGRTNCDNDYDCPKDQKCCQKLRSKSSQVCVRPIKGNKNKKW